jgi:hypothetical protein
MTPRYMFQRSPSRVRRWHLLALGAAAGAGIALAVTAARAQGWQPSPDVAPIALWAQGVCAGLRGQHGGDRPMVDPHQPIDVRVLRRGAEGAAFRCPPIEPGHMLPAVPYLVDYP